MRFFEQFRSRNVEPVDLEKLAIQVEEGRRLAIFERETGLYAYWYLVLRGEDECSKAKRYEWPLALAIFEQANSVNAWAIQGALTSWLQFNLRRVDVTAYVGNGRFVVLMPNTDMAGAQLIERRIRSALVGTVTALSAVPQDGDTFQTLYSAAASRLIDDSAASA